MKNEPISQAEMARQKSKLNERYQADLGIALQERIDTRFTMTDMTILTGWSQEYLFRLIKDKRIPQPKRIGNKRLCRWSEDQARAILGFKEAQQERFAQ